MDFFFVFFNFTCVPFDTKFNSNFVFFFLILSSIPCTINFNVTPSRQGNAHGCTHVSIYEFS